MAIGKIKANLLRNISNIPGWRSRKRIVVLESDDWGSIRMSSTAAFERLQQQGLNVTGGDSTRYNSFDTLESAADLQALFKTLESFRDSKGNHPVFTALSLVANPDFDAIRAANFETYHHEPFTITLDKYQRTGTYDAYQEGISRKLMIPQFHGREHLNINVWMRALQAGEPQTMVAFNEGIWGFKNTNANKINYQAAFDLEFHDDLAVQHSIITEGLQLFEKIFGYKATFFVPPNGPINNSLEATAAAGGIRFMSASKIQLEALGNGQTRKVYHYLGQQNAHGQTYITRNCFFEPSMKGKDWVASCLNDVATAFRWHKPAVVSTHRVNFTGSLSTSNRLNGLTQLNTLLAAILRKWPDLIFLTSNELGELIHPSNQ